MMKSQNVLILSALVTVGLALTGCQSHSKSHQVEHPAEITKIEGSDLSRVTLTEKAMQRLDLKTDQVRDQGGKKVVPYSSLIYDPKGQTWVYISPEPRTFVRHKVEVDYIEGSLAFLKEGPPTGSIVASVAVSELYGAELKLGH